MAKVRVYVLDKNDNSPTFTLPQYQANIPVDTPPNTKILKVGGGRAFRVGIVRACFGWSILALKPSSPQSEELFLSCQVTAEDADEGANSRVLYSLYEDDNADALRLFRINPETGDLYLTEEVVDKGKWN